MAIISRSAILALIWFVILVLAFPAPVESDVTPMLTWGTVTVDGIQAPAGTMVEVYIGDTLGGSRAVTTPGQYGAVVVSGSDQLYGTPLVYKVDGVIAVKNGPDPGVFGLENQIVDLAVMSGPMVKVWEFGAPGFYPRHLPDAYFGEVVLADLEDVPWQIQGVYKFDDDLGVWLFWAPGAPGLTLAALQGGAWADYMVATVGACQWEIELN